MTGSASAIPRDIYYHFAKKSQTVDETIRTLYTRPTQIAVDHFKAINRHLKNGQVQTGQLIIVTPPDSQQCSRFEADLMDAAELVDKKLAALSDSEKRIIAENYSLLNAIASTGGAGYGAGLVYFSRHVKNIESILKQIERLYVQTYNTQRGLNSPRFFQLRKQLFTLDQADLKKSLGLNTKSILQQWKQQPGKVASVPGFSKNYTATTRLAKTLRRAGYVGIALDMGQSALKIHEACTVGADKSCGKTSAGEGGRIIGSVFGGIGGAAAGYATCNAVFSIPTAGTSLLWCGIVMGVAGGYAGGKGFGSLFKSGGEVLYETIAR